MLLQLEILLRIVSCVVIIVAPIVRLVRYVVRRYRARAQAQQLSDGDLIDDEVLETADEQQETIIESDEFNTPLNPEQQVHIDPVIAALRQEEEEYNVSEERSQDLIEDMIEDDDSDYIETKMEAINEGVKESEVPQVEEEVVITEEIEIIEIDVDGDGIVDETIIIDTVTTVSASDLMETKRQKSIDMLQFELRNLKDKGQIATYEKKLIEARALHPDRTDFSDMLAQHYYDQGEYKKGLGLYRGLVTANSTDDRSLSMVANCYIKLGEWENAQLILEKLILDKPENPRYWMSLAEVYYNYKNIDKTIDCVRTMVKLRPTNMDYLSTLAQLYHETATYELYVQILYRMLELDPHNPEIKSEIEKYS